jgi:ABC-type phosphate transport system permease subunit
MILVSARSRHLFLLVCSIIVSLVITLFPTLAVHAAKGFTTQERLGFPAGDDWEPALAADRYGHVYVLYQTAP